VAVNQRGICRLCWKNASGTRGAGGMFDPIGGNRHGQQLFLADMTKAATLRRHIEEPAPPPAWPPGRPVAHRQLILFEIPWDLSRGRTVLPAPRDRELAAALDAIAAEHGSRRGWPRTDTEKVRAGIRILLGLQDTPGAMLDDDRTPAIDRWFETRVAGLPDPMAGELRMWFDVMRHGSTTAPRRRPRSPNTIKLYVTAMLPALNTWVDGGHATLREITRDDVIAVLPAAGPTRAMAGRSLRSLFTILKARKLVFANPLARVRTWASNQGPPLPLTDLDRLRGALDSPNPARALLASLVAFHGLRTGDLCQLQLVDLRDRHLHLAGRVERLIPLADPVQERLAAWLDHRGRRWPDSTNPHLFIHFRTAGRTEPVGRRWIKLTLDLPGTVQAVRRDRILHEALATGGDTRRLCDLFGLSINTASRYTAAIREPSLDPTADSVKAEPRP
jgi:site-specific recombinase XerD